MKSKILIYLIGILSFSACMNKDQLVPLNSVMIPGYEEEDYFELLKSDNPELVYNAICNLIPHAINYAITLSDSLQDSVADHRARQAYILVSRHLTSDDEWIACSALRFYANFGIGYLNKNELADSLLKIKKLKTKSIKLEYLNALKSLYGIDYSRFFDKIPLYLKSESWLVSRSIFPIMAFFPDEPFFKGYVSKYEQLPEYDKLLFIEGLPIGYDDKVLNFIFEKIKIEKSEKVRIALAKSFSKAKNINPIKFWLNHNNHIFEDIAYPISKYFLDASADVSDTLNVRILVCLFESKLIPDSLIDSEDSKLLEIFHNFYQSADTIQNKNHYIKQLYEEYIKIPAYRECWNKFLATKAEPIFPPEFKKAQKELLKQYKQDAAILYDKYGISERHKKEFLKLVDQFSFEFK